MPYFCCSYTFTSFYQINPLRCYLILSLSLFLSAPVLPVRSFICLSHHHHQHHRRRFSFCCHVQHFQPVPGCQLQCSFDSKKSSGCSMIHIGLNWLWHMKLDREKCRKWKFHISSKSKPTETKLSRNSTTVRGMAKKQRQQTKKEHKFLIK